MIAWSSLVRSLTAWTEIRCQLPLVGWDTLTLAAVSVALTLYLTTGVRNGIPGPMSLPILGNIAGVARSGSIDIYLNEQRKKYGDVFTITFGGTTKVVICGFDLTHHLLVTNSRITSSRILPPDQVKVLLSAKPPGIVFEDYPRIREKRNFTLRTLRDRGMGKRELEPLIQEEIREFLLKVKGNESFDFGPFIHLAVTNVIASIVFGQRFDYEDEAFMSLIKTMNETIQAATKMCLTANIPFLTWLPFDLSGQEVGQKNITNLKDFMMDAITERKKRLVPENANDFIEQYLLKMEEEKENKETTFYEENLVSDVIHIFSAGSDTTTSTLRWAALFMAQHPHVQAKIHQEIDSVLGMKPCTVAQPLPYIEATIKEIQRLGNVVPLAVSHKLDEDIIVNGCQLKKGMEMLINMASILHDPVTFPNPMKFNPERFLGEQGQERTEKMTPFGMGKRRCLGERLATMELKLFFTSIMQNYEIVAPPGGKLNPAVTVSVVRSPNSYKVIFKPRVTNQ